MDKPKLIPPVTCFIRTLNEAKRIAKCIHGVQDAVSEVIVIDSESTDDTLAIAESQGAKVITQPWLGNGFQKRVGEEKATHDWVLDIDADEAVTPELTEEIAKLFSTNAPTNDTVFAIRLHTLTPVGTIWRHYNRVTRNKLYNRTFVRAPQHVEWDQFQLPRGAKSVTLKHPIIHSACNSLENLVHKLNRGSSNRCQNARTKRMIPLCIRIIFGFPLYLFRYCLLRGYLWKGIYGFINAFILAYGRWLRDAKMIEFHLMKISDPIDPEDKQD
jgi:glycosyltransferase involved in cell wall biosynthesis